LVRVSFLCGPPPPPLCWRSDIEVGTMARTALNYCRLLQPDCSRARASMHTSHPGALRASTEGCSEDARSYTGSQGTARNALPATPAVLHHTTAHTDRQVCPARAHGRCGSAPAPRVPRTCIANLCE